jgi:hypothetical protein
MTLILIVLVLVRRSFTFNILSKWPSNVPSQTTKGLAVPASSTSEDFGSADEQCNRKAGNCEPPTKQYSPHDVAG